MKIVMIPSQGEGQGWSRKYSESLPLSSGILRFVCGMKASAKDTSLDFNQSEQKASDEELPQEEPATLERMVEVCANGFKRLKG